MNKALKVVLMIVIALAIGVGVVFAA